MKPENYLTVFVLFGLVPFTQVSAGKTGFLSAECTIRGEPAQLQLKYDAYNGTGITWGSGPTPDITGVIADGSVNYYWQGVLNGSFGQLQLSGQNNFLSFYDPNVLNRETTLKVTMTGGNSFYLEDTRGNYPGQHPCTIKEFR